jgi:2-polyprenyl-3-methyl-5-hydroxy-6-metoxy-1,4-benzoquinol methylase
MPDTSEHFQPHRSFRYEIEVNMERYMFALKFLEGKTVLDIGCGGGLGTYLYSLVAKKVYAVDYDANAIEESKRYPFPPGVVEFIHADVTDQDVAEKLPEVDVCVAMEVLEHIEEPAGLLRALKARQLVFGMPLHSMEVSTWHKYRIDTERDVRALIQPYYQIGEYIEQKHRNLNGAWIIGEGIRYVGN